MFCPVDCERVSCPPTGGKIVIDNANSMPEINYTKKPISQEQLQSELDYIRAQQLLEAMLEKALISLTEFNQITTLNRQSFSPALAEIMPDIR
jgi:DNA-binding LytR/AlgR family response regulator